MSFSIKVFASSGEGDTVERLKKDLEFETRRRKAFSEQVQNKSLIDKEREKGLALYLEQQEKWDYEREKGKHNLKRPVVVDEEKSPEYIADLNEKKKNQQQQEKSRQELVREKAKVVDKFEKSTQHLTDEEVELGLVDNRPRFDLRKRSKNKWAKSGSNSSSGGYSSGGAPAPSFGGYDNPPPIAPPADFGSVPGGFDSFDDFPPPPPPAGSFEGGNPGFYDSGYGDAPFPPPPPPPQMDGGWDF